MQTLGLSESTPRTENRLKSLFWPTIKTGADVDYIGVQSYWICTIAAVITFLFTLTLNSFVAILSLIFYYFGGVGVRERDRYVAIVIFVVFVMDALVSPFSVVKTILTVLLLSNVRATWVSHHWQHGSEDAELPPRMADTFSDKFADILPAWLWPEIRYPYYVFSGVVLLLSLIGTVMHLAR